MLGAGELLKQTAFVVTEINLHAMGTCGGEPAAFVQRLYDTGFHQLQLSSTVRNATLKPTTLRLMRKAIALGVARRGSWMLEATFARPDVMSRWHTVQRRVAVT